MRLLKVHTLAFEEFANERTTPKYGILSHRWQSQEVSYQDMVTGNARKKKGFVKVRDFCKHCALDGLSHAWIDTCCINKDSSAELSEAINSMFRWYQNATKCYAFLSDVSFENSWPFSESEWFRRGWTLQELIAPNHMEFFDTEWTALGNKRHLAGGISAITKIPSNVLLGESPREYSIAQRMSWAANRITTRIEDQAYSLMGLFDVNMPMLYGEGEKAFIRLQEEIIKYSGDQTIFAWPGILSEYDKAEMYDVIHEHRGGLLAKSPLAFALCGNIRSMETSGSQRSFAMTNMGISIELLLRPCSIDTYQAKLNCVAEIKSLDGPTSDISIYLRQIEQDGQYVREVVNGSSTQLWANSDAEERNVRVNVMQMPYTSWTRICRPNLRFADSPVFENGPDGQPLMQVLSYDALDPQEQSISLSPEFYGTMAILSIFVTRKHSPPTGIILRLGFDFEFNPRLYIDFNAESNLRLPPDAHASREWISSLPFIRAKHDEKLSRYVVTREEFSPTRTWAAVRGHRDKGLLVFLDSLNTVIDIEKRDLMYERYWTVDIQRLKAEEDFFLTQVNAPIAPTTPLKLIENCPICRRPLQTPIGTNCGHIFCQTCIDWADISIVSSELIDVPLDYNEFPTTDNRRNDRQVLCPLCGTETNLSLRSDLQRTLQVKYLWDYKSRLDITPTAEASSGHSKNKVPVLVTLTLLIGNTHRLAPLSQLSDKSDQNKHDWTFFVRPSRQEMVQEVVVHLHKSFRDHKIDLRHSPFEIRRWGWGTFTIFVEVILKPGYTILHDDATETTEKGLNNRMMLEWPLTFEDDGGQGKLRVKVQKHRSILSEADENLMAQFRTIRTLQRKAFQIRASSGFSQPNSDAAMSGIEI
ncbi:hypothetical protein LTR84_002742 [Exophiala bonariae]|uniref:RING-type domain-containing protein n=1 Tax=Exophiala bonariae TaxID=1690606 RepID=A0AAV9N8T8_9EURO|nr:hypothetical protein LTR84_002742 [Exophiala bonariae]